ILLVFFRLAPRADLSLSLPLPHFYVVTFTTFAAAVVSILLGAALGPEAKPRHVLAAAAFAVIGSIFFSHGLATPNALIDHFHPAVQWSAWLTLFGGGAMFTIAAFDGPRGSPKWLPTRTVVYVTVAAVLVYSAIAAFAPQLLSRIDLQVAPWHKYTIFSVTMALWLFAAFRLWQTWRVTHSRVDGVLAFVALWLAQATISLHLTPVWNLSWWLYHAILLIAFLFTIYILAAEYEQTRQFRLVRYYLAASLILTVLLALVASALFSQFSYDSLVGEIETSSKSIANNLASELTTDMPDIATPGDLQGLANRPGIRGTLDDRLAGLTINSVIIYDSDGIAVYASEPDWLGVRLDNREAFENTMSGNSGVIIRAPDDPPKTYSPSAAVHIIETYAPIHPAGDPDGQPIGILVTVQEAPQLNQSIIRARIIGLVTAALTMGLLFVALLSVVGRADRILRTRAEELASAYTNLRQAEAMRDDLTNMIVHDLRNPLTAISSTLDLLPRLLNPDDRTRLIDNARVASRRITGLIDDILTVGKIEAGELKPKLQNTQLNPLLADHLQTFSAQAAADNKILALDCPPGLSAQLDPALIGRVIENLLSNALKYTDRGGKIQVTAQRQNGRVQISVRDDGPGISDEFKERIFDKFVQAPNADDQPSRKGTGLGLAFCRLVVELHGGQIRAQDAPGGGSDFVFWIPRARNGA
ncbi:MAG TPA: sensor histidine kinase, partial [Anaerolineales bacterium]|nr:sensor histidine kinase [Anaerolineales bacterium]